MKYFKHICKRETKAPWLAITLCTILLCLGRFGLLEWSASAQAHTSKKRQSKSINRTFSNRKYQHLSKQLVKLRSSVDWLSAQIRLERTQHLLVLRGLENRRGQLQLILDQERLRLQRLRTQHRQLVEKLKDRKRSRKDIEKALKQSIQSVRKAILNSLPYRRKERIGLLTRIETRLKANRIDAEQGVASLWRILENELRLTSIVERTELPIVLKKGELPRLAKVVRVGMIALFVRKGKEHFGKIVRDSKGKWRYFSVKKTKDTKQIALLFKNLERQLHEGLYHLPLFAPQ